MTVCLIEDGRRRRDKQKQHVGQDPGSGLGNDILSVFMGTVTDFQNDRSWDNVYSLSCY